MALRKLTLTRGDTQTYTPRFTYSNGTAYDITNWTVYFTLKTDWSLSDADASVQKIVTPSGTAATDGHCTITLASTDTVNLDPGEYFFDIAVKTVANETYTVMKGLFNLEYDVTRTP